MSCLFKCLTTPYPSSCYCCPCMSHRAVVICPWGEEGASACQGSGVMVHSPAFPPASVVDTLGAGDTFNAATIFALAHGSILEDSIRFGCRVAGAKVGVIGWEPLRGLLASGTMLLKNEASLATWYREVGGGGLAAGSVEGVVCAAWVYLLVLLLLWQVLSEDGPSWGPEAPSQWGANTGNTYWWRWTILEMLINVL